MICTEGYAMKGLTSVRVLLAATLSLLLSLSLLMAVHVGRPVSAPVDFEAYLGSEIPYSAIDGVIGPEWDDAGHYTGVQIDPPMPSPYGIAEIWTKHDSTFLYIAIKFIADSDNPWVAIMPRPWDYETGCKGFDVDLFGDDNVAADEYVDAYFESVYKTPADEEAGGRQYPNAGAMRIEEIKPEEYLVTIELKKHLNSGDVNGYDIAWSVGGTYGIAIDWDSDGVGNVYKEGAPPGGSSGGSADHKVTPTEYNIHINPDPKPGVPFATVTLNPDKIKPGETSNVTVRVVDGTTPVPGANIVLSSDSGGNFSLTSGTSDPNGYFSSTFTAPNVSDATRVKITANVSISGYGEIGPVYEHLWVARGFLSVTVEANPSTLKSGETSTITVNVTEDVNPVPNATIILSSENGTFSKEIGNTDANGVFTSNFTAPSVTQQTTYRITANATKEGYLGAQNETQVTVKPSEKGIELFWIPAVAAVIVILVIAVFIIRRRGKEKVYEQMRKRYERRLQLMIPSFFPEEK
jgi:hypothetical protein